jgi:uncharacterized protein
MKVSSSGQDDNGKGKLMQHVNQEDIEPWYRQFWPWFLMALPASAVVASLVTVFIAVTHQDNLVVDDYYKQGLAINQSLQQQQTAKLLGLSANAIYDQVSDKITLIISANSPIDDPILKLTLAHATLAVRDQVIFVKRESANKYVAKLKNFRTGKWHLILAPEDEHWQLKADVTLPKQHWLLAPNP